LWFLHPETSFEPDLTSAAMAHQRQSVDELK
jgi:hypothetical protein